MAKGGHQTLTIEAKAKGFDETASKVGKVRDAASDVIQEVGKLTGALSAVAKQVAKTTDAGPAQKMVEVTEGFDKAAKKVAGVERQVTKTANAVRQVWVGFGAVGKTVAKLTQATGELARSAVNPQKRLADGLEKVRERAGALVGQFRQTNKEATKVGEGFDDTAQKADNLSESIGQVKEQTEGVSQASQEGGAGWGGWAAQLAVGVAKLGMALRAASRAFKMLPVAGAVVHGILSIRSALKAEIAERLRLIEVMKIQGRVLDELRDKQLDQKATLEQIASRRGVGGFENEDVARRVQVGAARAKAQYPQLSEANINRAFGTFGDVPGLSQEQLTRLAEADYFTKLKVDIGVRSYDSLRRQAMVRNLTPLEARGEFAKFERTETVQGPGLGRGEFRTGQPTEAAQRALEELRAREGNEAELRRQLEEILPPEADIDRAVRLGKLFGSKEALEKHKVGFTNALRPLTTMLNRLLHGRVELMLPDQPGFGSQLAETLGTTLTYEKMRPEEYENLVRALGQIEREGTPRQRTGPPVIVNSVTNYNQNQRHTFPSARAQQEAISNGETGWRGWER